VEELHQQIQE